MNRRSFLARVGAAFCGAMLATFPEFAVTAPVGFVRPSEILIYFEAQKTIRFEFFEPMPDSVLALVAKTETKRNVL